MCLESNLSQDIEYRRIDSWNVEMIADLYRAGGWWKEEWDPEGISALIKGSLVFAVAIDSKTSRAVGMGRLISDGVSDGYIQDLVVLPQYRKSGVGSRLVLLLVAEGKGKRPWLDRPDRRARLGTLLPVPGLSAHARAYPHDL